MNEAEQKVEFMKAHGFSENPDSDWLNQTERIWVSHEIVDDSSLSELTEKIRMDVGSGGYFASAGLGSPLGCRSRRKIAPKLASAEPYGAPDSSLPTGSSELSSDLPP